MGLRMMGQLICLSLLVGSITAITCGDSEKVCNVVYRNGKADAQCYNTKTHNCIDNLVCPVGTDARCGDSCFSSHPETGFVCFEVR
jgi:hypothetical protein